MNLLIFTHTFPFSPTDATAHFLYDWAKNLKQLGHHLVILLPYHPKLKPNTFPTHHLTLIPFRYIWPASFHKLGYGTTLESGYRLPWWAYLLAPFYTLFACLKLVWAIRSYHIDVISSHWLIPNGFIATLIGLITHTPAITTIPGSDAFLGSRWPFKPLANFVLRHSSAVVADSPGFLKNLHFPHGHLIPYGVPLNPYSPRRHSGLIVATAGRLIPRKGIHLLKKWYPHLTILSGLTINQFRRRLASVDIFVTLSIKDPGGNTDDSAVVLLEAMAAGCAVIATATPGYRRFISHRHNGLLVKTNKTQVLSAINTLVRSPKLRARLGQAARHTIAHSFTTHISARRYAQLFSS